MRSITMPSGRAESQNEVLRLVKDREGCVAHVRILVARDDFKFVPVAGRIDVAHRDDRPPIIGRPICGARLLTETLELDALLARLSAAFDGRTLTIEGQELEGHGLDASWHGARRTDDFAEYGASWPLIELLPSNGAARLPYLHEVYEAEGEMSALEGIADCARFALAYSNVRDVLDARTNRIAIYLWDYRGVFREKLAEDSLGFLVEPSDDPNLGLSIVARDDAKIHREVFRRPSEVKLPITGLLRSANITLRHGDDVVCELLWNEMHEHFRLQHDGVYMPPPIGAGADPFARKSEPADSSIAAAVFPFVENARLARMVARDLAEMDSTARAGNVKSALLLGGSILEAVLLDAIGRNEAYAKAVLKKKWPDRASAGDLIDVASKIVVAMPDGTTKQLLPPLTGKKGVVVIDHRDLIHPQAEIRDAGEIDMSTVQALQGILGEILRDLSEAHAQGVLDAYAAGSIV